MFEDETLLHHGGCLSEAAARYGMAREQFLDLSTGVSPVSWPVPALAPLVWARLPEHDAACQAAAGVYYGADALLTVAGSQAAIQALPRLWARCRVGVLAGSYAEHAHVWRREGHIVCEMAPEAIEQACAHLEVLILVRPDNPTGWLFPLEKVLDWQRRLSLRGGCLIVDEAFMDATPQQSLMPYAGRAGLIVLRSLGKFFGLAGARVGFVAGPAAMLVRLRSLLGPWPVSGPSLAVAAMALNDEAWQAQQRHMLWQASQRLADVLTRHGLAPQGQTALFCWCPDARAVYKHHLLAQAGIWTRLFEQPLALRFGLPGEQDWLRFEKALKQLSRLETESCKL